MIAARPGVSSTRERSLHAWMRALFIGVAGSALLLLTRADAAEPAAPVSPITQHHRAYREALAQGNLALAETEAASALSASLELKGDAPPTAALAVNLASLRLVQGQPAAAIEPARQALAIAEKHGDASGVDIHHVRLLLGRAELPGGDEAAMERLLQAVRNAQNVPGLDVDAYPAAVELEVAAHAAKQYTIASEAWIASARFARGSRVSPEHARGRAKLGEAAARLAPLASSWPGPRRSMAEFVAIDALLVEAMDFVHDQAMQGPVGGVLTPAQSVFGEAGALQRVIPAKLGPDERTRWQGKQSAKGGAEIGGSPGSPPRCERSWNKSPEPDFPLSKRVRDGVGSVVLKVMNDEAGAVTRVQVAGAAGGDEFVDSVVAAVRQWRARKADTAVAGCALAGESFLSVTFAYKS